MTINEGSGNQGILDIILALAWVSKNISAFGGDPENVMIFGESGGGARTSCLYAMPEAAPYFNKASIEKVLQHNAPVYLYNFGYKSEQTIPGTEYKLGTPHAMDITFKFNNETPANEPNFLSGNNPERFTASHQMAELWTSFA